MHLHMSVRAYEWNESPQFLSHTGMRHVPHYRALSMATDISNRKDPSTSASPNKEPVCFTIPAYQHAWRKPGSDPGTKGTHLYFLVKSAVVHIGHFVGSAFSKSTEIANPKIWSVWSYEKLAFLFISMVVAWLVLRTLEELNLKFAMPMKAHFIAQIFWVNHL